MRLVTVIIPTSNRPILLGRAVESVINQSYKNIEILIVLDGPNEETKKVISKIDSCKIKIIESETNIGAAQARNLGIRSASGDCVAFLDDDDEWAPDKIQLQSEAAEKIPGKNYIIGCRIIARDGKNNKLLASRLPQNDEPLWKYLFERRAFSSSQRQIQTSTLFMNRSLATENPFRKIQRHQDWDFLLRAEKCSEFVFVMLPNPLVILNIEKNRKRISTNSDAQSYVFSLNWINSYRESISGRAYADFILTVVTDRALRSKNYRAAFGLILEALRRGRPSIYSLVVWFVMCAFSRK